MNQKYITQLLFLCFFLSGAAGLVYEVVWARQMTLFLGITAYANTAIIAAFMIGLSLGSVLIGRISDRFKNILWLYIILEVGIGIYAAFTPQIMYWLQSSYTQLAAHYGVTGSASHVLRFMLALLALLIPTMMMGGTLPVLVRAFTDKLPNLPTITAKLYGINTLGAALGTFIAGYFLLPILGIRGTIYLTVVINFAVALIVWVLMVKYLSKPSKSKQKVKKSNKVTTNKISVFSRPTMMMIMAGFMLSGFAALVYELAWIRSLTLVIGSSVYAFSTVLSTYLFGLALGSLIYGYWSKKHRQFTPMKIAAYLEFGVAISAMIGLYLIPMLPELFLHAFRSGLQEHFSLFQLYIFFLSFLLMIIPTLLLGALFPLITSVWASQSDTIGRNVGSAYALNTLGTIAGTMVGGLILMELIGVQYSLILGATVHMFAAGLFWFSTSSTEKKLQPIFIPFIFSVLFGGLVFLTPTWDRALMTSGVFVYGQGIAKSKDKDILQKRADARNILYYKEGVDAVVSVVEEKSGNRMLIINGKIDASSKRDLATQTLAGAIPILMHPDPKEVLIVGLGSGIMVGSVTVHKAVKNIDLLEISEEVIEASAYFAKEHHNVLADPRVNLIVADARNYIAATSKQYDVIVSEPSNPWISGISNLFTQEYFSSAHSKLNENGIMMQWLQTYKMSSEDVKTILHTFNSIYQYVSVWMPMRGDLVLIGSDKAHAFDMKHLEKVMKEKRVEEDLKRIGITDPIDLLQTYLIGGEVLHQYSKHAKINSDDHPYIEFNAPKNLYSNTTLSNLYDITFSLNGLPLNIPIINMVTQSKKGLEIPAMHLFIRTDENLSIDSITSKFQVTRQLQQGNKNRAPSILIAHSAYLSFKEKHDVFSVSTAYFKQSLDEKTQQKLLQNQFSKGILKGGTLKMHGGEQALWMQEKNDSMHLGLIWTCDSKKKGTALYHLALLKRNDKTKNSLKDGLKNLTQRFECR